MKITLFMCAGALSNRLGIKAVAELDGAGRLMPVTMGAFSIGALGMIGVPPVAGFISKWYLGIGGLQSDAAWVVAVLAGSSLLNAAYFLPMLYRAWLLPPPDRTRFRELGRPATGCLPTARKISAPSGGITTSAASEEIWLKKAINSTM